MDDARRDITISVSIGDVSLDVPVSVTRKQALALQEGTKIASVIRDAVKALAEDSDSGG